MNGEAILDAMNYLDDDLIEATGKIRTRKKKSYLYVLAAAAACLCLMVVAQGEKSSAPTEAARNEYSHILDQCYCGIKQEAPMENDVEAAGSAAGSSVRGFATTVCVLELRENSFVAGITGDADGGKTDPEALVIHCGAEVLAALEVGDVLEIHYTAGESNVLVEYSILTEKD